MKIQDFKKQLSNLQVLPMAKNKRYIILPLKKQIKTETGIILPESTKEQIGYGIILKTPDDGVLNAKPRQIVQYNSQMGYPTFVYKKRDVLICYEVDIFAVFEETVEDDLDMLDELEQDEREKKIDIGNHRLIR